jgi:hypothetical protein
MGLAASKGIFEGPYIEAFVRVLTVCLQCPNAAERGLANIGVFCCPDAACEGFSKLEVWRTGFEHRTVYGLRMQLQRESERERERKRESERERRKE